MRYVEVEGVRAALSVEGMGIPLLLLHGLGCANGYWQAFQQPLAATHALYAPDLPGHGLSRGGTDAWLRLCELTDWVARLCTQLQLERVVVVGHSLGGGVAVDLAARYPSLVRGVALLAPTGVPDMMPLWEQCARICADGPLEPLRLYPQLIPAYLRAGPRRMWRLAVDQQQYEQRQQFQHVRCPTLILRGSRDPVVTRAAMLQLMSELPNARYHEVPRAAHALHVQRPQLVASAVARFVRALV